MEKKDLTYGNEGFKEVKVFLEENYHKGFTLSLYNLMDHSTAEIICSANEMIKVIMLASSMEHDFPAWIGINELTESYVVGMNFTRGRLKTFSVYEYIDGQLIQKA